MPLPLILIVEDDEQDALLMVRTLREAGIANPLRVIPSGLEAVAYLRGEAPYLDRAQYPLPVLVLLDLRMPVLDGFGVLKWIRSQAEFQDLGVFVLTASSEILEFTQACSMGATSFLVKPLDFENVGTLKATLGLQSVVPSAVQPLAA